MGKTQGRLGAGDLEQPAGGSIETKRDRGHGRPRRFRERGMQAMPPQEYLQVEHSEEISQNIKEGENASIREVRPAEWPFLGYRDRDLEDEYLDDMTCTMKSRILVGYVVSIIVFFFGPFMQDLSSMKFRDYLEDNPQVVAPASGLTLEVYE